MTPWLTQQHAITILLCMVVHNIGCHDNFMFSQGAASVKFGKQSTDIADLRKLCNLPSEIKAATWQTYKLGNDWGLLAVLEIEDWESLQVGEKRASNRGFFVRVDPLPDWMAETSGINFPSGQQGGVHQLTKDAYDIGEVARSPLLHGTIIQGDGNIAVLHLVTN